MSDKEIEIVGHKTVRTGPLPGDVGHEPLTRAEAGELWKAVEAEKAARAADMPDEDAAIKALNRAYLRLKELGWKEPPRYTSTCLERSVLLVEPACTKAISGEMRTLEYGRIVYWVSDGGDIWPSTPVLIKEQKP